MAFEGVQPKGRSVLLAGLTLKFFLQVPAKTVHHVLICPVMFAVLTLLLLADVSFCEVISCTADNNDTAVNASVPGSIRTPNFPAQYPNNLQCTWRITAPEGGRVRLVLRNLTLGDNDYITFRDGVQDDSPEIAKYGACAKGELRLYSTNRYVLVNFVSDASSSGTGFQVDFESLDSNYINCTSQTDDCLISNVVNSTSAYLLSKKFPMSLPGNLDCRWRIELATGYRVLLQFLWFGLAEKTGSCRDDFMATSVDSQRGSYCGCEPPPKILSLNTTVELHFITFPAANHPGFLAFYRAVGVDECQQGGADACPLMLPKGLGTNRNGDICYELVVSSPSPSSSPTTGTSNMSHESGGPQSGSVNIGALTMFIILVLLFPYL